MGIYKDCDIRGIFGTEFDESEAYILGKAVAGKWPSASVAVGGDVRLSTPVLKEKLIRGLTDGGLRVTDLGIVTTPMFYFSLKHYPVDGGIMVTASHNPAQYNGFKLMFGNYPITAEEIKDLEQRVQAVRSAGCRDQGQQETAPGVDFSDGEGRKQAETPDGTSAGNENSRCQTIGPAAAYSRYIQDFGIRGTLRIVVDCCNGTTGLFYPDILRQCGYDVIPLYCDPDGRFPNRDPNPAKYECLTDLKKKVIEEKADLGAAYDGDGDRVVFVDNLGRHMVSEEACAVFAIDYLKREKGAVVYDQKSASVIRKTVLACGGEPLMEKSGYGYIKRRFLETDALLGGEVSGHFFFRELGNDDGLYATLKMCSIMESGGGSLSEMADRLPKSLITPDLRCFCSYGQQDEWLAKVRTLGSRYPMQELDGVRLEFPRGWFLIRRSVTEEAVTLRIEADSREDMSYIQDCIIQVLPEVEETLRRGTVEFARMGQAPQ